MRAAVCVSMLALAMCSAAGSGATSVSSATTNALARQARWLTTHGGVIGTCAGCATLRLRSLSKALVVERFSRAGAEPLAWALCVVGHESGFNPGAVNASSGAAGLSQTEVNWHHEFSDDGRGHGYFRLTHDPAYAVAAMWRLSRGARDRTPWTGGGYSCP